MPEITAVPPDALAKSINLTDEDVRLYVDGEAFQRAAFFDPARRVDEGYTDLEEKRAMSWLRAL
ncbi:MAG TPA: hypothetical protein VM597_07740 [Gemmataceae bacterium]|nr:hypothetical protein [Gemmataceae bacterium]